MVVIDSFVENKGTKESNGDTKVDLEIQSNMIIMALTFHWLTTTIIMLVSTSSISVFVCYLLIPIYGNRLLLFRVKFFSHMLLMESVTLFIKPFKDISDISIYKRFFVIDDLNDN